MSSFLSIYGVGAFLTLLLYVVPVFVARAAPTFVPLLTRHVDRWAREFSTWEWWRPLVALGSIIFLWPITWLVILLALFGVIG